MDKIKTLYVFIVNQDGVEKIVTWPNENGIAVPLVYISQDELENDKMRIKVQDVADKYKAYFELREYQLVEKSVETYYPALKEYNA